MAFAEYGAGKTAPGTQYWLALHPAAAVVTRGLDIPDYFVEECKAHQVPLLRTQEETSPFLATLIAYLNAELAPRITRHGVLVEVYGEGVLITGESGAGKSEAAVELIKRGHRLIADDAVEIRKVSDKTLIGASPSNIRHFVELRGIGIINARRIFGMGAVKNTEKLIWSFSWRLGIPPRRMIGWDWTMNIPVFWIFRCR